MPGPNTSVLAVRDTRSLPAILFIVIVPSHLLYRVEPRPNWASLFLFVHSTYSFFESQGDDPLASGQGSIKIRQGLRHQHENIEFPFPEVLHVTSYSNYPKVTRRQKSPCDDLGDSQW